MNEQVIVCPYYSSVKETVQYTNMVESKKTGKKGRFERVDDVHQTLELCSLCTVRLVIASRLMVVLVWDWK